MKHDLPDHELLSAYLDGELTSDEQAHVEKLLAASPAARQLLDELCALSSTLQSLPQQTLGEDLGRQVLRVAQQRKVEAEKDDRPTPLRRDREPELRPLWKEISWRGMLGRRALVWTALLLLIALLLHWTEPKGAKVPPPEQQIAQANKEEQAAKQDQAGKQEQAAKQDQAGKAQDGRNVAPSMHAPGWKPDPERRELATGEEPATKSSGKDGREGEWGRPGKPGEAGKFADAPRPPEEPKADGGMVARRSQPSGPGPAGPPAEAAPAPAAPAPPAAAEKMPAAEKMAEHKDQSLAEDAQAAGRPASGGKMAVQHAPAKALTPTPDVKPEDGTTVIHCTITADAARSRAFDRLLASSGIALHGMAEDGKKFKEARDESKPDKPEDAKQRQEGKTAKETLRDEESARAEPLDLVLVEASPEQIASVLKQLKARPEEFPSVTEFPTAAGQSLLETQKGEGQGQERRKELGEAAADRSGGDKRNSARDADQGGGQASASIAQEKLSATEEGVADAARADHGKREQAAEPAPYAARIPPPRQRVAGAGESLGRSLNAPAGGQSGADFGMGGGAGSASGGPAALSKAGSGPAPATEARPAPDAPKPEAKAESPPRVAPANQPKQPDQPKGKLAPHRTDTFKKEREKDAFRDGVEGTQPGRPSSPHRVLFVLRLAGSDVPASASKESRAAKAEVTKAAEPASPAQAAPVKE